jgi:hypothetical protein
VTRGVWVSVLVSGLCHTVGAPVSVRVEPLVGVMTPPVATGSCLGREVPVDLPSRSAPPAPARGEPTADLFPLPAGTLLPAASGEAFERFVRLARHQLSVRWPSCPW